MVITAQKPNSDLTLDIPDGPSSVNSGEKMYPAERVLYKSSQKTKS